MATIINNFEILNGGTQLALDVETNSGYVINNIDLWTMANYKDYGSAISLNSYLENVNNHEVLIINAVDIGVYKFEDILFTEISSSFTEEDSSCEGCSNPTLGVTYNLGPYYNCLLSYLLELQITQCVNCNKNESNQMVITINMLIDNVVKCIEVGYYTQAIDMIAKLKKLCSLKTCTNCPTIDCPSCRSFIQI